MHQGIFMLVLSVIMTLWCTATSRGRAIHDLFLDEKTKEHMESHLERQSPESNNKGGISPEAQPSWKLQDTTNTPIPCHNRTDYNHKYCYELKKQGFCDVNSVKYDLCPETCGTCGTPYTLPPTTSPTTTITIGPDCYHSNCVAYPGKYNCITCPASCHDVTCSSVSSKVTAEVCAAIRSKGYCYKLYIYCPEVCSNFGVCKRMPTCPE